jgi:hypothetical protein
VQACVLAVRDDELDVRHDDGASLEVAEKGHVRESRKLTWMGKQSDPASRLQFTRIPSDRGNRKMT